jgi:hypothetical protein
MRVRLTLFLIFLLMLSGLATHSAEQSGSDATVDRIFIGQAYPSGNVYVRAFFGGTNQRRDQWPKDLVLIPLIEDRAVLTDSTRQASLFSETAPAVYVPALEGMDDQHDSCGSGQPKASNRDAQYLSDDFFDALIDHCETNEDVAIYHSSASKYSLKVLGFSPDMALTDIRYVTGLRPMMSGDQRELEQEKQALQKIENASKCTTVPVFIDAATRLIEAQTGNGRALRLASFKSPGCAGHLATTYILDVLQNGTVLTTIRLTQNHGVL